MTQRCSVCRHPQRTEYESRALRGETYKLLGSESGAGEWAMRRHMDRHVPREMALAAAAADVANGDRLLHEVLELKAAAVSMRRRARAQDKIGAEIMAQREVREAVALLAKITGELPDPAHLTINVIQSAEFQRVTTVIMNILAPYPAVRAEIAAALAAEADADDTSPR